MGRLARKKALVQEMEAIEALARVNVLCLDKTGTITTGKLDVVDVVPVQEEQSPEEITTIMSELTWAFDDVNSTQDALRKKFKKTGKWKAEEKIPFSSDRSIGQLFLKNMEDMPLVHRNSWYQRIHSLWNE